MRHLLLTGVMITGALLAVWGVADLLEGSQRHDSTQAELQQPSDLTTPLQATPAATVRKVAGGN